MLRNATPPVFHEGATTSPKTAWSIAEWCDEVGIGRKLFYKELKGGRLKAKKCGGRTLVVTSPLEWLENLPDAKLIMGG